MVDGYRKFLSFLVKANLGVDAGSYRPGIAPVNRPSMPGQVQPLSRDNSIVIRSVLRIDA